MVEEAAILFLFKLAWFLIRKHTGDFLDGFPKGRNRSTLRFHVNTQTVSEVNAADINQDVTQPAAPFKEQLQDFREEGEQAAQNDSFGVVGDGFGQDQEQDAKGQGMPHFLKHIGLAFQMDIARDEQIWDIWKQANVEVNFLSEQEGLKIIVVGGQQDAQSPQHNRYVFSFQNTLPFRFLLLMNRVIEIRNQLFAVFQ